MTIDTYMTEKFRLRDDTVIRNHVKFEDWSDIVGSTVFALYFSHRDTFTVIEYDVLDVDVMKPDTYKIHLEDGSNESHISQTFIYDEDANVVYKQNMHEPKEVKFLIHPGERDRLIRLRDDYDLDTDTEYSMCDILQSFDIKCTSIRDDVYRENKYWCQDDEHKKLWLRKKISENI